MEPKARRVSLVRDVTAPGERVERDARGCYRVGDSSSLARLAMAKETDPPDIKVTDRRHFERTGEKRPVAEVAPDEGDSPPDRTEPPQAAAGRPRPPRPAGATPS